MSSSNRQRLVLVVIVAQTANDHLLQEEIEAHKKEWELGRLQAEKEETLRLEEAMEEDREPLLTCHRDDAYNQVKKRSKTDHELSVDKDRQNCVKVNDKKAMNKTNNRNVSSVAKRTDNKSVNASEQHNRQGVRRSPRSPVVAKSRAPNTRNSSHNSLSSNTNNHIKRSNSRSVSKPIENGNQTNGPNVSNANRRSR